MAHLLASVLVVATGLVAVIVGWMGAAQRLRCARRAYRKTTARHEALSGGWDAWFLGGFSGVTMGTQWLSALAAWAVWTLAGVCFIGLGVYAFR